MGKKVKLKVAVDNPVRRLEKSQKHKIKDTWEAYKNKYNF